MMTSSYGNAYYLVCEVTLGLIHVSLHYTYTPIIIDLFEGLWSVGIYFRL